MIEKELYDISWKVIPGFSNYLISNEGVIKALPKVREGRLDGLLNHTNTNKKSKRYYKEKLIKQHFKQRYWYACLTDDYGKKQYCRVHRLIYKAFVKDIPQNMVIDHIDGNTKNNNLSNLRCVTISENCQNPNTKYKKSKPILQIDPSSLKVLNEFKNSVEAEMSFGIEYKPKTLGAHISECCKGNRRTAFGYFWQYKDLWESGINTIKKDRKKAIIQFNLDGDYITEYPSIKDAALSTHLSSSCIQKCAAGKIKFYKNYIWKYKENH